MQVCLTKWTKLISSCGQWMASRGSAHAKHVSVMPLVTSSYLSFPLPPLKSSAMDPSQTLSDPSCVLPGPPLTFWLGLGGRWKAVLLTQARLRKDSSDVVKCNCSWNGAGFVEGYTGCACSFTGNSMQAEQGRGLSRGTQRHTEKGQLAACCSPQCG